MADNITKCPSIRVSNEFLGILDKVREYMKKYSYGILEVSNVDASKLLSMKIEKFGGIDKFLKKYRLELE